MLINFCLATQKVLYRLAGVLNHADLYYDSSIKCHPHKNMSFIWNFIVKSVALLRETKE